MTRLVLAAIAALAVCVFATGASAATQPVDALFATFSPTPLDVLPGETVEWKNVSQRRHTVTADDGSFDSGDLLVGDRFSHDFTAVGAYEYHCTVHPGMDGEVDVRRVTLGPLPATTLLTGAPVKFEGRTADPARPVTVELDTGGGFRPVGLATPSADGDWRVTLKAQSTGRYRAVVGADTSQSRRLVVSARKVVIRSTRRGVAVRVTPRVPYGRIVLWVRLRERFGWWPAARKRLDFASTAVFKLKRRAQVRVALVGPDGWTPLATSRVLGRGRSPHRRPGHTTH
jgi:plastocyanin